MREMNLSQLQAKYTTILLDIDGHHILHTPSSNNNNKFPWDFMFRGSVHQPNFCPNNLWVAYNWAPNHHSHPTYLWDIHPTCSWVFLDCHHLYQPSCWSWVVVHHHNVNFGLMPPFLSPSSSQDVSTFVQFHAQHGVYFQIVLFPKGYGVHVILAMGLDHWDVGVCSTIVRWVSLKRRWLANWMRRWHWRLEKLPWYI